MDFERYVFDVGERDMLHAAADLAQLNFGQYTRLNLGLLEPPVLLDEGGYIHGRFNLDQVLRIQQIIQNHVPTCPLFSVVTRNTAHQMSYCLADYAFDQFSRNTMKTVINLDAHQDYSDKLTGVIRFSNWGAFVSQDAFCAKHEAELSEYCIFGENCIKRLGVVQRHRRYQNGRQEHDQTALKDLTLYNNRDVYLSLDMDVMTGSYTVYDDGYYTQQQLLQCLETIFTSIQNAQNCKLVGLDVTGLPCPDGHSRARITFDRAYENVNHILRYLAARVREL